MHIVRQPHGHRAVIMLSSRPPYINHTMPVRWPCGSRRKSVFALCNRREIMCMDLKPLINLFIVPFYNEICIALTENIKML